MIIIVAAMVLIPKHEVENPYFALALILPVMGFWILNGYFLWQERLFRKVYDEVRVQSDTDFKMDLLKHKDKPKCSWYRQFSLSRSLSFTRSKLPSIVFVFLIFDAAR